MCRLPITPVIFCFLTVVLADAVSAQEQVLTKDQSTSASNKTALTLSSDGTDLLQFSFADASWPMVLQWIAENADLSLDLADEPEGSFNYIDDKRHTVAEAIDVVNGYLLPRGYVLLRRDQFLVVLKTDNPVLPNLIPTVPSAELDQFGNNELLRMVVQVEGFTPEQVASQVEKILGPKGVAVPLNSSGALVLQGFGKSLREAIELLDKAKAPPADDKLIFRSFTLKHIAASDAERQIQNLFGLGTNPFRESMQRRAAWLRRERGSREGDREQQQNSASPTPLLENIALNMKVSSLRQTNSLLVTATPAAISLLEEILQTIDVRPASSGPNQYMSNVPELRVYTVDNADEDDVAETVNAVIPGVVINEDGRNNSVHVLATQAEHAQVDQLISIINSGGVGSGVEVIPLTQSDPVMMSELLAELFENEDRDDRPVITPGFQNRSLIVRGSTAQMGEIRKALASFNEHGGNFGSPGSGGRFRRLPLNSSRDAERIARMVKGLLESSNEFDNRIRVVVPGGEIDANPQPGKGQLRRVPLDGEAKRSSRLPSDKIRFAAYGEEAAGESLPESAGPGSPTTVENNSSVVQHIPQVEIAGESRKRLPQVTIEVRGSELFLYSNDAVALDDVEKTVRDLVRQMPTRTQWTIFFLRAAPADTVAATLVNLLRSDASRNVVIGAGEGSGYSGTFNQPIRIIPDLRTNSLFISGSTEQVGRAEQFLEFLDTRDLPGSLRDREPRSISVQYANVNDVAQMIRELYQDYMVDPLAVATGSRRGEREEEGDEARVAQILDNQLQRSSLRPSGIQLTLTVD